VIYSEVEVTEICHNDRIALIDAVILWGDEFSSWIGATKELHLVGLRLPEMAGSHAHDCCASIDDRKMEALFNPWN
jgi:hypothetical protein